MSIYDFIAESSGAARAWAMIERIQSLCLSLETLSGRGAPRDDLAPDLRCLSLGRFVVIAYRVLPDAVEIIAIAWGGQDIERLWQEL